MVIQMDNKSYEELITFQSYMERFEYLKMTNVVGQETFGIERYLNQKFYHTQEWKRLRDDVIVRDNGCDMGWQEHPILSRIIVHHINPITIKDVVSKSKKLFDMNNLISVSHVTHLALHFGSKELLQAPYVERSIGDTKLW